MCCMGGFSGGRNLTHLCKNYPVDKSLFPRFQRKLSAIENDGLGAVPPARFSLLFALGQAGCFRAGGRGIA